MASVKKAKPIASITMSSMSLLLAVELIVSIPAASPIDLQRA
jgi:hypothetical protein